MHSIAHYVYVISSARGIKIGVTCNVRRRMYELQTGNAEPLSLWFVVPFRSRNDAETYEQHLHQHFDHFRVSGEWFMLSRYAHYELYQLSEVVRMTAEATMPSLRRIRRSVTGLGIEHIEMIDRVNENWNNRRPFSSRPFARLIDAPEEDYSI